MLLGILGTIFSFILIWNPRFAGMTAVVLVALNFLVAGLIQYLFCFATETIAHVIQETFHKIKKAIRRTCGGYSGRVG
jgi:hypothetical protein